jgi:hypothetical protein
MWTTWICATTSGIKLAQVDTTASTFTRQLNGVGTGSHDLVTASLGAGATLEDRRASRLDITRTWARTVVQCWNDEPVYAGLIVGKTRKDDGTVTLNTVDVREILKYRTTFGINGYNGQTDGQFSLQNMSLAAIAGSLIWDAEQGTIGNWDMPWMLPSRVGAGPEDRVYHEYNLPVIETELAAIQDFNGGPDIDFSPLWSGSRLRWDCRVGALTGATLDFNLSAPESPATGFGFVEDGNAQGNVFYAVGNGSDRDLKVYTATAALAPDEPALERIVQYSQERAPSVLLGHARAAVNAYQRPTRQYSLSMQADGAPGVPDLSLGQTIRTYVKDDDWLSDGWLTHRLIGFSGDLTNTIKLQLQAG